MQSILKVNISLFVASDPGKCVKLTWLLQIHSVYAQVNLMNERVSYLAGF